MERLDPIGEKEKKVFVFKGKIIETRKEFFSLLLFYGFAWTLVGPGAVVLSHVFVNVLDFRTVMAKYDLETPGIMFVVLLFLGSVFVWWIFLVWIIGVLYGLLVGGAG